MPGFTVALVQGICDLGTQNHKLERGRRAKRHVVLAELTDQLAYVVNRPRQPAPRVDYDAIQYDGAHVGKESLKSRAF
jgi:hypothetical protein